jgi:uncharacterized membrane protein YuzA (DUF378 family)
MIKFLDVLSALLLIIGGLNWGLYGLFDIDLVAVLLGAGTTIAKVVYALVALSALYRAFVWHKGQCGCSR